jgi:hypothetical protein
MSGSKLLHIYLADHLAAAIGMQSLAKRSLSSNTNTALGRYLEEELIAELEEDRGALENVMDALGASKAVYKQVAARFAVQAGRLKLNGRTTGYSPLSRLEEIEGMCLGMEAKLLLWRSLAALPPSSARQFRGVSLDPLIARAERQRGRLEHLRLEAAVQALTSA